MTTFVVSGAPRTGTSMVMHCVGLGGMELAYSREHEKYLHKEFPDSNPYFYEFLHGSRLEEHDLHGKAVKLLGRWSLIIHSKHWPLNIVFMCRDPIAQEQSNLRARRREYDIGKHDKWATAVLQLMIRAPCVESVAVMQYEDFLERPLESFQQMKDLGWPIDIKRAAEGVQQQLKHF